MMIRNLLLTCAILSLVTVAVAAPDMDAGFEAWQGLVGSWKGVGRPKRSSAKGSWTETMSWSWSIKKSKSNEVSRTLKFESKNGKYFKSGELTVDDGRYQLKVVATDGKSRTYVGKEKKGALLLSTKSKVSSKVPARVQMKLVADGERLILLLEKKLGGTIYTRLGEIGFTREGGSFASGSQGPECIVTGGKGTIAVTHKGKTYYVCCSGCKEYFDENPEECIKEWEKEQAKKKK